MMVKHVMVKHKGFYAYLVLTVLTLLSSASAQANQNLTNALRQAEQGNLSQALSARSSLSGTARDTLDWYVYTKGPKNVSFAEMANFLNKHPEWPYSNKIQREAESKLRGVKIDSSAVQFFNKNTPITAVGMDAYAGALVATGQGGKAKKVLNDWWKSASLTRDEQRQIFSNYSKYLTRQSHVDRMDYLLRNKQYTNGSAIAAALGGGYPALARARIALLQGKGDVNGLINAVPSNLQNDEGLLFARLQWRRKKGLTQGAIEILNSSPPASKMAEPKAWWKERHIIVRRLMEAKQYKTAYSVASSHKQKELFPKIQAEWVSGFLALRFVNQAYKAFNHFEALYKEAKTPLSKSRGAYWSGRASEALNHGQIATQWYNVAAKFPETFYGQLSGEKLGRHVSLNMRGSSNANAMPKNSMGSAATYLSNAGLKNEASAFLLRLKDEAKSTSDYEAAANLATRIGQPQIAIKIAQQLQKDRGVSLGRYLYPQKERELKNIRNVEWAFINAIIRQESRFDSGAVSHAGARGLMQLMPATAKQTASRAGISHNRAWLTSRPAHNIALGSRYLGQMTQRYSGNYAMAAAAYNAGPGRVDRWIKEMGDPRKGNVDFIDWVEQIPIYETRNYVQRVLEGVYVYRDSLKGKQPPINAPIHVSTK